MTMKSGKENNRTKKGVLRGGTGVSRRLIHNGSRSLSFPSETSPRPCPGGLLKQSSGYYRVGSTDLDHVALDELCVHGLTKRGRAALDDDASSLEGRDLGVGTTLAAADNGTCLSGQKC
jgi:hypothetical protein